jgi:hypothetical protein
VDETLKRSKISKITAHGMENYKGFECCGDRVCIHRLLEDLIAAQSEFEALSNINRLHQRRMVIWRRRAEEADWSNKLKKNETKKALTAAEATDITNILPFILAKKNTEH